jgi:FtsP/CotA-like multicopper oxidase with cupredoxin domain
MSVRLSRRALLATPAALALAPLALTRAEGAAPPPPPTLTVVRRSIEVNGRAASVFGIDGPSGPGLTLAPGARFNPILSNRSGEETIVHWHGQTPPVTQDGVAMLGLEALIADGSAQAYDFAPRPGTYWMHSHQGLQEQLLLTAPLIVHSAEDAKADEQEVVVMLHDFSFRSPQELLASLTGGSGMAGHDTAGHGTAGHGTAGMAMPGMSMPGMAMPDDSAKSAPMPAQMDMGKPDLNDITYDAYLANDRTLADPMLVRAPAGQRVRLRLINGASATAFWIDLGTLEGTVVAVDGHAVQPVKVSRFPLVEAQRADVLVTMPGSGAFPVLAQREGDTARTGIILATPGANVAKVEAVAANTAPPADLSLEWRLNAAAPLAPRNQARRHKVTLSGTMSPYAWAIDGAMWPDYRPLHVRTGERVEVEMVNLTGMAHPMHLHGHVFQVIALQGKPVTGAMRDTVIVPANGSVTVAFDADNPGRWLFHCHNLYHMATGMMSALVYDDYA